MSFGGEIDMWRAKACVFCLVLSLSWLSVTDETNNNDGELWAGNFVKNLPRRLGKADLFKMEVDDKDAFNEAMGDIDWDDTFDMEFEGNPAEVNSSKECERKPVDIFVKSQHRYIVTCRLTAGSEKFSVYTIKGESSGTEGKLELHDYWHHRLILESGMLVNIVDSEPDDLNTFVVSRNGGFVVVQPDLLLPITSIMSQLWCERKSALGEVFQFPGSNLDALRGTIAHDIIGRAMVQRSSDMSNLKRLGQSCISSPSIRNCAYGCKLSQDELDKVVEDLLPYIQDFISKRFLNRPRNQSFEIVGVCDIEDMYWNPVFGLKGKLDANVKIKVGNKEKVVPLEFKTGQARHNGKKLIRAEHTGQVSLYTLLVRPRYGIGDSGLLLYIREDFLHEHKVPLVELQNLICMRNTLAINSIPQSGEFRFPQPGSIDFDFKCGRCEYQSVCGAMLKLRTTASSPSFTETESKLVEAASYLGTDDLAFFHKWFNVISLEIESEKKIGAMSLLWKTPAKEREKKGICIGDLKLLSESPVEIMDTKGNRCSQVVLTKAESAERILKTLFLDKDLVILSTQYEICIAYATIEAITDTSVTLSVERRLHEKNRAPHIRFCIDKIVSVSALQTQYSYLCQMMGPTEEAKRIRDYIIRKTPPKYTKFRLEDAISSKLLSRFNQDQRKVFRKATHTDSFLFVKGMPGTGKTETIVGLLQILVQLKCSVLLVAYTKNAVDNILVRYKQVSKDFLRVGEGSRFGREQLQSFNVNEISKNVKSVDDLTQAYNERMVVGCTLLSLKHEIFSRRTFDYCIVDEASQALPTSVLGALLLAKKCILFGDPDQLPAIIKSDHVKAMNIEDSMYALAAQPVNTVKLSIQYRMNSVIMDLANKLVYKDQMSCGGDALSESFLDLPTNVLKAYVYNLPKKLQRWISSVLSKKLIKSVVFLETSSMNAIEEKIGETLRNVHEAQIVKLCVKSFVECGCKGTNIGVIAPFRGQVSCIQQVLADMGEQYHSVEVNTVDQYQGRDKDIIICSFTKSKTFGFQPRRAAEDSEVKQSILDDIRRLNVAVTRAKKKLILIGNCQTLKQFLPFQKLFSFLENDQLVVMNSDNTDGVLGG